MKERQLITRVLAGDARAERALYDANVDRIYRLAYRMTGDETLAEDFTQETFIRAFDRLADFRRQSALSTWLHAIAVSVVLNGLRKIKRHRQREIDFDDAAPSAAVDAPPHALRRRIHQAIDHLQDEFRLVFVMHDIEGYKHQEIAAALSLPVGTSKTRLARAREMLREMLAQTGGELAQEEGL